MAGGQLSRDQTFVAIRQLTLEVHQTLCDHHRFVFSDITRAFTEVSQNFFPIRPNQNARNRLVLTPRPRFAAKKAKFYQKVNLKSILNSEF